MNKKEFYTFYFYTELIGTIIVSIGILAVLNMLTDEQCIVVGWIFIGIWIIKILTEK